MFEVAGLTSVGASEEQPLSPAMSGSGFLRRFGDVIGRNSPRFGQFDMSEVFRMVLKTRRIIVCVPKSQDRREHRALAVF